jgi:hypothetical protein
MAAAEAIAAVAEKRPTVAALPAAAAEQFAAAEKSAAEEELAQAAFPVRAQCVPTHRGLQVLARVPQGAPAHPTPQPRVAAAVVDMLPLVAADMPAAANTAKG